MAIDTEICVIGGGPAGAVAALRLAQLGRQVCLLERAAFPRQHVGESLTPSVWPILNMLGLSDRIAGAGFLRPTGSVLHWGGVFERRGPEGGQAGLLIDRGRFDALLLAAAQEAGVKVLQPARAYRPVRSATGWNISAKTRDQTLRINARVLVDAAGRQAGLGRKFQPASPPLLALYAYWQAPAGFGAQARVEAGDSHWYWGALLPDGTVNAMVFVDPAACTRLSPSDRRDLYLNLLAQSTLLSPCLEQRRIGPVRRSDATSLIERTSPAPDLLRVGEASLTVDPLSSQGVQLAMGQAIQAATVVNTVLSRPEHTDLALSFYRDRQIERVCAHAGLAADFYARHQRASDTAFWVSRAQPFDWLKQQPPDLELSDLSTSTLLRLSPLARLLQSGTQAETLIRPGLVLAHPNLSRPVANLENLPLAAMLQQLENPATAPEIMARWSGVSDADHAQRILAWLWRHRVLIPAC